MTMIRTRRTDNKTEMIIVFLSILEFDTCKLFNFSRIYTINRILEENIQTFL